MAARRVRSRSRSGSRCQRPTALGGPPRAGSAWSSRPAQPRTHRGGPGAVGAGAAREQGSYRRECVVADTARPDQVPQGGNQRGVVDRPDPVGEGAEEQCPFAQRGEDRLVQDILAELERRREEQVGGIGEGQRYPAVAAGYRTRAAPHHLAGRAQLVQIGRCVVGDPGGQHQAFQGGGRDRHALQLVDGGRDRVNAAGSWPPTCCQRGQEPGERARRHRLDLLAQRGQAAPPQQAQHLGVAPLDVAAVGGGRELAGDHATGGGQPAQRVVDHGHAEPEAVGAILGAERAVRAGVAGDEVHQRIRGRLGVGGGQTRRQGHPERVAITPRVFGDDEPLLAGEPDLQHAHGPDQAREPTARPRPARPRKGHRAGATSRPGPRRRGWCGRPSEGVAR